MYIVEIQTWKNLRDSLSAEAKFYLSTISKTHFIKLLNSFMSMAWILMLWKKLTKMLELIGNILTNFSFFCIWTVYWQWSYLITTFDQFSKKCLVNCQNKGQWFAIDRFKSTKTYFKEWILGNFYSFPYRYHDHDRLLYLATQFYI